LEELAPVPSRWRVTAERNLWNQLWENPASTERELGNCDCWDGEYIQTDVEETSLEPYIILAKLRFDITFSRHRAEADPCHSVILRRIHVKGNSNRTLAAR
jgi:hypothetical protein